MTFSDLVAAMERRFPKLKYRVGVEFQQDKNVARCCEHEPEVRRTLVYTAHVNYAEYSGSPDTIIAQIDAAVAKNVSAEDLARVNAGEVQVDGKPQDYL